MEKDFDFVNNGYTGKSVIERGYEIYDKWTVNGFSSRKVVNFIDHAVFVSQSKKTPSACVEALSCLFALDLRIKKKYNTLFRCLFLYFSWRRETNALKRNKNALHIVENTDIRTAIEIELQRLREKLEGEESDDGDDETRGGKRNGKAQEEATAAEQKENEQASEEKTENLADEKSEEGTTEEKTEESPEQTSEDEPAKAGEEKQQSDDLSPEESEAMAGDEAESIDREEPNESKEERNGSEETAEPSIDKPKEIGAYNDAVDSPPLYESPKDQKSVADKTSFIDEVIIDNMIKGKEDFIHHDPLQEVSADHNAPQNVDAVMENSENVDRSGKDAYLYDEMMANERDTTVQETEKTAETKSESQTKLTPKTESVSQQEATPKTENVFQQGLMQNTESIGSTKQESDKLRVPLQVDITLDQENNMRRELSSNMTSEEVQAFHDSLIEMAREQLDILEVQAKAMREQLKISSADLGMDAPVEVRGKTETAPIRQPSVAPNRK